MKNRFFRGTLAGLMWLACVSMLAQGTVDIFNGPGSEVDAPVYDVDGVTRLAGAAYQAQLFAGPAADQLVAVGAPLPFRTKYGAGYWQSGDTVLVINSVPPGAKAFIQIRVWEAAAGTTYEAAMAAGGKRGTSLVLSIVTGGGGAPPSLPPMLVGLESFRLFQGEPPKVVSQPQNQTVIAGNPASFEVVATGTEPVAYQWFKNGVAIPGAIGSQLFLSGIGPDQVGSYMVAVTDLIGTVTSSAAVLTVLGSPSITSQPVGLTAVAGTNVTLSATASGSAPLSYQWIKGGLAVAGGNGAQLTLNNVQPSQAGSYSVVVTNLAGTVTSSAAVVTVLVPPSITRQPVGLTVVAGTNVTLSATASGTGPLSYRWLKDGSAVAGGNGAQLALNNVQPSQAGSYAVVVTNLAGTVTSSAAAVTVLQATVDIYNGPGEVVDAPVYGVDGLTLLVGAAYQAQLFAGPAADQLVAVGAPLPFRTNLGAGYWQSGDTLRVINSVLPGATAFVQIRVWEAAAGATYEAAVAARGKRGTSLVLSIVTGGAGAPPSLPPMMVGLESFRLFQEQPPQVVLQPLNQTVIAGNLIAGNPAGFEVVATGTDPLAYQWFENGVAIYGAIGSQLFLSGVWPDQLGSYYVMAFNVAGVVTSDTAFLTVLVPPSITSQPVGLTVVAGTNVTLSVTASGTGPLSYQWKKDGSAVAGGNDSQLALNNVQPSQAGSYTVVVTNLNTHSGLATNAHGGIVSLGDPRLTDARTPLTHGHLTNQIGSQALSNLTANPSMYQSTNQNLTQWQSINTNVLHSPITLASGSGAFYSLYIQELGLVNAEAKKFWAGPLDEAPTQPTYRYLADTDLPTHNQQATTITNPPWLNTNNMAFIPRHIYLSTNGSASVSTRGSLLPCDLYALARSLAIAGDTIIVYPGDYAENFDIKNGVNIHLMKGARITGTYGIVNVTLGGSCDVTGEGEIAAGGIGIYLNNFSGSIKLDKLSGVSEPAHITGSTNYLNVRSPILGTVSVLDASSLSITAPQLNSIFLRNHSTGYVYSDIVSANLGIHAVDHCTVRGWGNILALSDGIDARTNSTVLWYGNSRSTTDAGVFCDTGSLIELHGNAECYTQTGKFQLKGSGAGVLCGAEGTYGKPIVRVYGDVRGVMPIVNENGLVEVYGNVKTLTSVTIGGDPIATYYSAYTAESLYNSANYDQPDITGWGWTAVSLIGSGTNRIWGDIYSCSNAAIRIQGSGLVEHFNGTITGGDNWCAILQNGGTIHLSNSRVSAPDEVVSISTWSNNVAPITLSGTVILDKPINTGITMDGIYTLQTAVVTVVDNDLPGAFSFSAPEYRVKEDGTALSSVLVTRTGGSSGTVTVVVTPGELAGGATAGLDYVATPISVTFEPGNFHRYVTVPVLADTVPEGPEAIALSLSLGGGNPPGTSLGVQTNALMWIEDDAPVVLSARLEPMAAPAGAINLRIHGPAGKRFVVQKSLDLHQWTGVHTNRLMGAAADYSETQPPPAKENRFYRLLLMP